MAANLLDDDRELLDKQTQVIEYLSTLMHTIDTQKLALDDLCTLSGYSPSHLIRRFKQNFGMTPHAYIINKRIQYGQQQLKKGISIIDTA